MDVRRLTGRVLLFHPCSDQKARKSVEACISSIRFGDQLSVQFISLSFCGEITYSCNAECLFRRYRDELVDLQSPAERPPQATSVKNALSVSSESLWMATLCCSFSTRC